MTHYIPRRLTIRDGQGKPSSISEDALIDQQLPLVLLGDPGMGKTRLLEKFKERTGYHFLTAARFLRTPLDAIPKGILLLDALDEVSAGQDSEPLDRVLLRFGELGWPDFILSCRAADWRGSTHAQAIADDYGRSVCLATLEPLSSAESTALLEAKLGKAAAIEFHDALVAQGLAALLANPQSLDMLLDVAKDGVPSSRADLFARAAAKMVAEHSWAHDRSALNELDVSTVLDGAGAAMAMLVLGGKEGVFRGLQAHLPEGFEHVARICALPLGQHCGIALTSRLFRMAGEPDSFKDCHRTVAEYLGARWLGRVVAASDHPARMVTRMLALMHSAGRVPASLRGLHAWLAHHSHHFAEAVIAADPYGVLRYGDLGDVSREEAERVWASFARHGETDPWFRAGDWYRFQVAGLVQAGLGERLSALLEDATTSFHLRSLILDLLPDGGCVPEMREVLLAIIQDPKRTYSERHDAVFVLAGWRESGIDWPDLLLSLCRKGDLDAARFADEAIGRIGVERFSDQTIADIVFAKCGGYASAQARARHDRFDDFWVLTRIVPLERCAGVLDAIARRFELGDEEQRTNAHRDLGHLTWTLIARQIPGETLDPARLWCWLEAFADHTGQDPGPRTKVASWLTGNARLRQGVQAHILLTDQGAKAQARRHWHLGELSTGLYFQEDDVLKLLERLDRRGVLDDAASEAFRMLVRGWNTRGPETPAIREALERCAEGNPVFQEILHPPPRREDPETRRYFNRYEKEQREAEAKAERRRQADRRRTLARLDDLRNGHGRSPLVALRFLGVGKHASRDHPPVERISGWIGEDMVAPALQGFEATLQRPLDATLHELTARILPRDTLLDPLWPVVAGLLQRHLDGRGFADLSEDHVIAGLIAKQCVFSLHDKHSADFGNALEAFVTADVRRFERYLRALIEPQIATDESHLSGTHYLLGRQNHHALRVKLLLEWYDDLADRFATDREALVDALLDAPAALQAQAACRVDKLITLAPPRAWDGEDRTAYWTSLKLVRDFERSRAALDAAAEDRDFLWALQKALGHSRFDGHEMRAVPIEALVWVFNRFEARWPETDHPRSSSSSRNAWDASTFLTAVLFRIAQDTGSEAVHALHRLVERGSASYGETLRAARARQRVRMAETEFVGPPLEIVAAALREEAPQSAADIKAIALDAIATVQARIAGSFTDTVDLFYNPDGPKNEDRCRNALLDLLAPILPYGIIFAPEERMPNAKRADVGFRLNGLRVPLEAKLAWNPKLWSAAAGQLDRLYASADHMAEGQGIYLVFWFGPEELTGRAIPDSPLAYTPASADELREMLASQIIVGDRLSIVVLDVTRRPGSSP